VKILAVDTSGFEGSVAISEDRHVLNQRCLNAEGRRHAQMLVLEVGELLKSQRLKPADIDIVAVSIGPGSFTGLRVGVVFAKTFAWANNAKLVAVDTLQAVAQQLPSEQPSITVISDAQRDELFVNKYEWNADSQTRQPTEELRIEPLATVAATPTSMITGPGLEKFKDSFKDTWTLAAEDQWLPRAATIAQLGSVLAEQGTWADIHNLEPLYVRRSYAEEKLPTV
jgi:tRNA threonylcarbamoyladenosine biosynthesis protein TsaB